RRGVFVSGVDSSRNVAVVKPVYIGAFEEVALAVFLVGIELLEDRRIDRRIDQRLVTEVGTVAVAGHQRHGGGEIPARAVATHRDSIRVATDIRGELRRLFGSGIAALAR